MFLSNVFYRRRIEALSRRIKGLTQLRSILHIPPAHDITPKQWFVLENQLFASANILMRRLKKSATERLSEIADVRQSQALNHDLGVLEIDLTKSYAFFDTYLDVLTQRQQQPLGSLLAGCDALAWDALNKDHPALELMAAPIVYCDRGFGAAIIREGVSLPDGSPNPLPLIQIPYSRLLEKYNLTSVIHESGHEAMVRLGMVEKLPVAIHTALINNGVDKRIAQLFALWMRESGPDFWTFCATGAAQAASIRDILLLPASMVFRISPSDPHPPPFIRVMMSFEWCRQIWGFGIWDEWQDAWLRLYPVESAPEKTKSLLRACLAQVPLVSRTLLSTRFRYLHRRRILDFFEIESVNPQQMKKRVADFRKTGKPDLNGLSPCGQLAVFNMLRNQSNCREGQIDTLMTDWLVGLGKKSIPFMQH